MMETNKLKNWRFYYFNGILAIIFGIIALLFPNITIYALAIYFAITMLIGGALLSIGAVRERKFNSKWSFMLMEGMLGMLIGLVILIHPPGAAAFFVVIMGIWAMIIGLVFIIAFFNIALPRVLKPFHLFAGLVSLGIGLLMIINPFESTRIIVVLIGIYAIVYGGMSLYFNKKGYVTAS
ncbi:MAG: HdeD family acid-resistance protein [Bacteroidota bacterium]